MAYVPGFVHDVFVSYASLDDKAVDRPGWVTRFVAHLRVELGQALGREPEIFFDAQLRPSHVIAPDLEQRLRHTAVLIAVVTPGYLNSRWCDWELQAFVGSCREGELIVGTQSRAIRVMPRPLDPDDEQARVLSEVKGAAFYTIDANSKQPQYYVQDSPQYMHAVTTLARDVVTLLKAMRRNRTVLIGDAPKVLEPQRRALAHELEAQQDILLPMPAGSGAEVENQIRAAAQESSLCLHFTDAATPAHAGAADAARDVAGTVGVRQMVIVHSDDDALPPAPRHANEDIVTNPSTESLKEKVLDRLGRPDDSLHPGPTTIYLACHPDDHPLLHGDCGGKRFRDFLHERKFEVRLPNADGSRSLGSDTRRKLKGCHAVILFWGHSDQDWFEGRLDEVAQAAGWRKGLPFAAKIGYVTDPQTTIKKNFETQIVELFKVFGPPDPPPPPPSLEPVLDQLKAARDERDRS